MDWTQFLIMLVSMIGMFAWLRSDIAVNRSEAAADRRQSMDLIIAIKEEMKDFHGRLCAIEERNRKNQ